MVNVMEFSIYQFVYFISYFAFAFLFTLYVQLLVAGLLINYYFVLIQFVQVLTFYCVVILLCFSLFSLLIEDVSLVNSFVCYVFTYYSINCIFISHFVCSIVLPVINIYLFVLLINLLLLFIILFIRIGRWGADTLWYQRGQGLAAISSGFCGFRVGSRYRNLFGR